MKTIKCDRCAALVVPQIESGYFLFANQVTSQFAAHVNQMNQMIKPQEIDLCRHCKTALVDHMTEFFNRPGIEQVRGKKK